MGAWNGLLTVLPGCSYVGLCPCFLLIVLMRLFVLSKFYTCFRFCVLEEKAMVDFSRLVSLALGIRDMSTPNPELPAFEDFSPTDVFLECYLGKESVFRELS